MEKGRRSRVKSRMKTGVSLNGLAGIDVRVYAEGECILYFSCSVLNHPQRPFECGVHFCKKGCHAPSFVPPACPWSTKTITHCPCGKHKLGELGGTTREKCTDPIATCGEICNKPLEGCEHLCSVPCMFLTT